MGLRSWSVGTSGLVAVLAIGSGIALGQAGSAFDPSGYLDRKASETAAPAADHLTSKSIYRINGNRFQMISSTLGAVLLPSIGSRPEVVEEFALCPQHLKLLGEVIPVRESLAIEPEIQREATAILAMIQKCREGKIKGPTLVVENPDGSLTEMSADKPEAKPKAKAKAKATKQKDGA